ncbi:MAG: hypothetical protein ACEQSF_01080 [Solirubrobacteraceae bacterium]|jgi:hypothetical protein
MKKYILFLLAVFVSCGRGKMSPEEAEETKIDFMNGDHYSYVHIGNIFAENQTEFSAEILPYALVLARDSTCDGCYDFYYNFLKASFKNKFKQSNIYKLEKPEQDLLLYYLKKGAKKENEYCRDALIQFYENGDKKFKYKADSLKIKIKNEREVLLKKYR